MNDDDRGLAFDLGFMRQLDRRAAMRQAMRWIAGATLVPLIPAACADSNGKVGDDAVGDLPTVPDAPTPETSPPDESDATDPTDTGAEVVTSCDGIPPETAGPFPGDGRNGPNALTLADIVRKDIRSSIGALSGTAAGVPLTVRLRLVDSGASCAALAGYAVYLWHCDRDGEYSMYTLETQNYLRGVQVADADGFVEFTTIFPACYPGRWPHMHFEVFPSLAAIAAARNAVATSQLALPKADCDAVFATRGYERSMQSLAAISLSSDSVFRDGADLQIATTRGSVADGYHAELTVGV